MVFTNALPDQYLSRVWKPINSVRRTHSTIDCKILGVLAQCKTLTCLDLCNKCLIVEEPNGKKEIGDMDHLRLVFYLGFANRWVSVCSAVYLPGFRIRRNRMLEETGDECNRYSQIVFTLKFAIGTLNTFPIGHVTTMLSKEKTVSTFSKALEAHLYLENNCWTLWPDESSQCMR
jgi:hypothetical protein